MHLPDTLKKMLDSLPDLIMLCDSNGRILHCNSQSSELLGYTAAELVDRHIDLLIPPEVQKQHRHYMQAFTSNPRMRTMHERGVIEAVCKNATTKAVSIALNPMSLGHYSYTLVSIRESEETKAGIRPDSAISQNLQLQRLESIGLLSCGIVHDIRNLLGIISGNAELLKMGLDSADEQYQQAGNISVAAEHLRRLSEQVLNLADTEENHHRALDLRQLIEKSLPVVTLSLPDGIELVSRLESGPLMVNGSESQLMQMLLNLVLNARDAISSDKGRITVSAGFYEDHAEVAEVQTGKGHVYIQVEDNGHGISSDKLQKIFEPFYSSKKQGKGLGLYVISNTVQSHKGTIQVNSRENKGSVFTILLPCYPAMNILETAV